MADTHVTTMLRACISARQGVAVPGNATCRDFIVALHDLCRETGMLDRRFASIEFGTSQTGNGRLVLDTDEYGDVEVHEGRAYGRQ